MKRIVSTSVLTNEIDRYRQTVTGLCYKKGDFMWFPLFINGIPIAESIIHKKYDTVALAFAIKAISETKVLSDSDCMTVKNGIQILLNCRNKDCSWSTFYSSTGLEGQGIVFNTLTILDILIDLGYLDKKSRFRPYQDSVRDEIKYVLEDLNWILKMSVADKSGKNIAGWNYCSDPFGENAGDCASTLITSFVLSVYKKIMNKIEQQQPDYFEESKIFDTGHPFGTNGKLVKETLEGIIKNIEIRLIETQNSDGGWGKSKGAPTTVAHSFSAFNALIDSQIDNESVTACVKLFLGYLKSISYNSKKQSFFTGLKGDDVFDSYPQYIKNIDGSIDFEIIDHETFVEPLIIRSIVKYVDFCSSNKISYPKSLRKKLYSIVVAAMSSIKTRMEIISGHHVIRTQRGISSQTYPMYAIVQVISAWNDIIKNQALISRLLDFSEKVKYWLTSFGILAFTGLINWVLLQNNKLWQIACVTIIGFGLDFLKDVIAKKKKRLE